MKAGLPVPIRVAEHPAPALPGGKVAKSLTWRQLPGRIAGPHPLLVNPGFATLVVANVSVSEPGPNSNAKPAGLTPDRFAEWLHLVSEFMAELQREGVSTFDLANPAERE